MAGTAAPPGQWPEAVFRAPVGARLHLVDSAEVIHLPVQRWHGPLLPEEAALFAAVRGPILDVGCGPGRHAAGLAHAGLRALGIDTSRTAVRSARRRGADALRVSVFGRVPDAGKWATVLLLDGNIGIGGNPVRLLRRVRDLAAPGATVLVEVDAPGRELQQFRARVHHAGGSGPSFPWARVGATGIAAVAEAAGLTTVTVRPAGDRWFAELQKRRR